MFNTRKRRIEHARIDAKTARIDALTAEAENAAEAGDVIAVAIATMEIFEIDLEEFVLQARVYANKEQHYEYCKSLGRFAVETLENVEESDLLPKETICRIFSIRPKKWSDEESIISNIVCRSREPLARLIRDAVLDYYNQNKQSNKLEG